MKKFGLAIVKKCISLALSIILLVNSYPILLAHAASAPTYDQVAQKYSLSYVDTYTISGHSYKYYDISYSAGTELPVFFENNILVTDKAVLEKLSKLYMLNQYHSDSNSLLNETMETAYHARDEYAKIKLYDYMTTTLDILGRSIGALGTIILSKGTAVIDQDWVKESLEDMLKDIVSTSIFAEDEILSKGYDLLVESTNIIKSMPKGIKDWDAAYRYINAADFLYQYAYAFDEAYRIVSPQSKGSYFEDMLDATYQVLGSALSSATDMIIDSEIIESVTAVASDVVRLLEVADKITDYESVYNDLNNVYYILPPGLSALHENIGHYYNRAIWEIILNLPDALSKECGENTGSSVNQDASNAVVEVVKSSNLKTLPCSSGTDPNSKTVRKTTVGEQLEITASVVNSVGNLWYKTYSNGTTCYVYAGDTSIISDPIALNNVNYPNTLKQGSVYVLNGTITSKLSNLTKVTVGVYNSNGSMVTGATVSPNNRTYNIHNVDNQVLFNILSTGQYTYQITATNAAGQHTLLSKSFSVTASSNTTNQTPQTQEGKVVHCQTIVQLPARVINLYTNPTDASRTTYFDYGPRVNCPEYMIMSDGSIMYHGNVNHKGVDTQMWFKKEADMSFDIRHTYNNNICECGATKSSLPTNSSVATDKTCYQVGETVTVTPHADNAVKYTISVYSGGNKIFSNYSGFTNSISFTPEQVGSYSVVVSCIDSQGKYVDATCTFSVVNESRTISDGTYAMFSQYAANLRLDIDGSSDFEFNDDNPGKNRQFKVIYQNNGYYKIQDIKTGKYFTAVGTAKGSDIQIQEENNSDAQLWAIRPAQGNYYYICSKSANLLPIEAGSNSGKLSIRLGIMDGIAQQMWMFDLDDAEQDTQFPIINSYDTGLFIDVKESAWFAENVKRAYEYGLMNGTGTTTFNPDDNITIAETITIASRICSIYNGDNQPFARINNAPWYQPYVNYAQQKGIIPMQNSISKYNDYATKLEFAQILANALPDEALKEKNDIKDNAIPDVNSSTQGAAYVYQLYRAGVLTGNDSSGRFFPSSYITRAETAAVVSRMADPALRMETLL